MITKKMDIRRMKDSHIRVISMFSIENDIPRLWVLGMQNEIRELPTEWLSLLNLT